MPSYVALRSAALIGPPFQKQIEDQDVTDKQHRDPERRYVPEAIKLEARDLQAHALANHEEEVEESLDVEQPDKSYCDRRPSM